jgi:hypothetical protein
MATITKRSTKPLAARGLAALAKAPTGIKDLDEVTGGGLPRGAGFLADVRRLLSARLVVARHCWLWPDTAGDGVSGSRHHQVRLKQGLLQFRCVRPTLLGLEALFAAMQKPPGRLPEGKGVTAMFTSLGTDGQAPTNHLVASLIDTWLLVRTLEGNGEHNRVLTVHRSRGMPHSNQVREFLITDRGVELADVYVGPLGGSQGKPGART